MREKKTLDKKHLPSSVYEQWLKSQHPRSEPRGHKVPAPDVFEAWVEKRAEKKAVRGSRAARRGS
jgi:hypothetical protein